MNEIDLALMRHKNRVGNIDKENTSDDKKISKYFTKILLSIIFVLASTIYMKLDTKNLEIYKKYVFESNFTFTKINNWYHQTFGNILPTVTEPNTKTVAAGNASDLVKEKYLNGYKIMASMSSPISSITSGILVFMGEKEGYGNTLIIQGVDGVDIWYGGIKDTNLKLYDYVDANTILGNTIEKEYYLVFQKDGAYLSYEEYLEQISS